MGKKRDADESMGELERLENQSIRGFRGWVDTLLGRRFKVSDEGRAEVQMILTQPRAWLKGEWQSLDQVTPWEKLLFLISGFTGTSTEQWGWGRGRLFTYTFGVNPNMMTVSGLFTSIWDALNDPFIGGWMDRNPWRDNTYRWVRRINHAVGVFLGFFFMLDLGLTPPARVVMYTILVCVKDILGTMSEVANTKFYAGITPLSAERGKMQVWTNVGQQMGYPLGNIPAYILGFAKDRQIWSDYKVYTWGYAAFIPLMLCSGIVTTFARNRIQFGGTARKRAMGEMEAELEAHQVTASEEEPKLSIRESIAVIKHNKYVLYDLIANVLAQFTPSISDMPLKRFMFPKRRILGRGDYHRGEGYMQLSKQLSGLPVTFLYPFLGAMTRRLGGPKRTMILNNALNMACHAIRYFTGYKSIFGLAMLILTDAVLETLGPLNGYAGHILNYEMLDYVEYKTGVRSEGITMAFRNLINKIIAGNIDSLTGNLLLAWSGSEEIARQIREKVPDDEVVLPERYKRIVWPIVCLIPVVDNGIFLIARILFPYKYGQNVEIEAELAERRALAKQKKQELDAELVEVGKAD